MSDSITVKIRPSSGKLFDVEFVPETTTVAQLKQKVSEKLDGVEPQDIRLVFSGRILKDDSLCNEFSKKFRLAKICVPVHKAYCNVSLRQTLRKDTQFTWSDHLKSPNHRLPTPGKLHNTLPVGMATRLLHRHQLERQRPTQQIHQVVFLAPHKGIRLACWVVVEILEAYLVQ